MTCVALFLINIHKFGVSSAQGQLEWSVRVLCNQSFVITDMIMIVGNVRCTFQNDTNSVW